MWNDTSEGRAILAEISKTLIVNIAPEELEIAVVTENWGNS
jgi:hypothetical protein